MYSEKVMDHFQNPRNVGEIEDASGVGTVGNAKCGDIMRIFLDIDDETHIIKDCKFKTLSTIQHPIIEMGRIAADFMLQALEDKSEAYPFVKLKTRLLLRQTTR